MNDKQMSEHDIQLIAKFMGWTVNRFEDLDILDFNSKDRILSTQVDNWSTIMEIVEKIETLNECITIEENFCCITNNTDENREWFTGYEPDGKTTTKIQSTYNAIMRFINWYNEQEK